jgi:6-phosphofructokinase 1
MNAAVRTVAKLAAARGHEAMAVRDGYSGLMAGTIEPLGVREVDGISRLGGTILGSARAPEFHDKEGRARALAAMDEHRVDGLIVIGGNGSLTGAHMLAQESDKHVVGVPASIDNDIGHTRTAIGVDTAVNTIVEACDRITDTATAHRRAFVVEVMGRDCGFLAMRAGIAAEADAILYAESGQSDDEIVERLRGIIRTSFSAERDKRRVLIIKSEGVRIPTVELCDRLRSHLDEDAPGVSLRETVLGHVVRGGRPSQTDRVVAQRLAFGATLAVEDGATDVMVGWEVPAEAGDATADPRVRRVALADVLSETARLLDGTSPVTQARVALLRQAEKVLSL